MLKEIFNKIKGGPDREIKFVGSGAIGFMVGALVWSVGGSPVLMVAAAVAAGVLNFSVYSYRKELGINRSK